MNGDIEQPHALTILPDFLALGKGLVYAVIYSAYFFPWSTLRSFLRPIHESPN
ncbi:MAG: hypothetical protein WCJ02_11870 [bacterium]